MTRAEELEAIRARHVYAEKDSISDWVEIYGPEAHADRAFLLAEVERLREVLVTADLTIRSFPHTDQSHVEFIRAALNPEPAQ